MDITYGNITTTMLNKLIAICDNINRFGSIDACFKAGFETVVNVNHTYNAPGAGGRVEYVPISKYRLTGNAIPQQSAANLTNDYNAFIAKLGLNLNEKCTVNGMFYLLENITEFAKCNIFFATSIYTGNKWVVYIPSNESVRIHDMSELSNDIVRENPVVKIIKEYVLGIRNRIRAYPAIYTYTIVQ